MAAARTLNGKTPRFWGLLGLVFFVLVTPVRAQDRGRTISGTVATKTGSRIPNARVSIKNAANGETKTLAVNQEGAFALGNLSPGTYEITVSAPGFADSKTTVTIRAGADQTADIVLQRGNGSENGKREGGTSGVSGVVSSKSVSDLPLNARSASDLATLEPGVASARTQVTGQAQRGFGNEMTISGGRPRQNDSRLDGISVNDYVNGPPGSALGVNLGSDVVEQFTVLSSYLGFLNWFSKWM